jgi:SanA protein
VDATGRGDRICRVIGLAGVVLFLVSAFTPLAYRLNQWMGGPPRVVASDAIVVLGGSVSPSGVLSQESQRRTTRGIELYQLGLAPVLVLLGRGSDGGPTEAEVRAAQARLHGVPAEAILTETRGYTTRDEAVHVKTLLEPRHVRTVLLVTNAGHLARARPLFEQAGFDVRGVPSDPPSEADSPESRMADMRVLAKELFGWLYYRVAGYI